MQSPDRLDIVPEHVADPVRRDPWRMRLVRGGGHAILSLVLNGLVLAGMIGVGWPLHPAGVPHSISIDLVDHMPEAKSDGAPSDAASSHKAGGGAPGASPAEAEAPKPAEEKPKEASGPAPQAAAQPEASPPAQTQAEAKTPPELPSPTETAQDPPRPSESQAALDTAVPQPETPAATEAVPPPPEHPDGNREARLVAAPSAPPLAPPQAETASAPPQASEAPQAVAPAEQAPQRPVLSAPDGTESIASPAPPPATPKPLTAEEKRQAAATATLAAMLPFGANIEAAPPQSMPSGQGQGASTAYRGAVYANFNKAQDVIADAKARHLKGQAVIAFTVDDRGGLASIGVAVSSGNPAVDQAALEMIRHAAPFPPPPPGAPRSFSPAIGLGLDD